MCPPTVTDRGPERGQSNQGKQILLEKSWPWEATEDLKGPLREAPGSPSDSEGQSSKPLAREGRQHSCVGLLRRPARRLLQD